MASGLILYGPLKHLTPAPYRNIPLEERFLVLLLITAVAPPHASADPTADSSSSPSYYPYGIDSSFNSSMKYILAVLIIGMFFVAFFLFYLRQCLNDGVSPPTATANNRQQFACGLDSSVVNSFPVFLYSAVKGVKIGDEVLECAVCISEFEDDESLRLLPKCHHVFHPDCIDAWLASHSTCPVCRANLAPEKLAGDSEQTHELSIQSPEQRSEPRSDSSELPEVQNQVVIDVERETTQTRRNSRFPRSHSTGHSLVRPGENCERYTLRLPEEVRIRKQNGSTLKRAKSCDVVLAAEGSSRRGRRGNQDRLFGRSDRWMFTMTPPFIAKTGSIGKGDVAQSSSCYPV